MDDFAIPAEVKKLYQETIFKRGAEAFANFKASAELEEFLKEKHISINIDIKKNDATRNSSGSIIKHLNETLEN